MESKLEDALDRIKDLEEKVIGTQSIKKEPDNKVLLGALKSELLNQVDDKTKDLLSKHEEIEETKAGLEKRIKQLERKLKALEEDQDKINQEMRDDIESLVNRDDPLKGTQELERKLKQLDQKRKRDSQDMQDGVMDLIDQKLLVLQKERANKIDRIMKDMNELNKRVDVHDDDLVEMTKVIQELDRDRIQDGKATTTLKQQHDILNERIDHIAEAILEINSIVNKNAKMVVDHNDLNQIKEACLQDFNTLTQRITDISETVEVMGKFTIKKFIFKSKFIFIFF